LPHGDEKADRGGDVMSNERNGYRTALVLFAVAVIVAMLVAFVTTFERVDKRNATSETPPGTTSLAKAHPPLDRAPGQPVIGK
jgi:Na+/melibiose symporter-like transporter